ncbi:MAG: hypothetical protein PHI31_09795 [Desulfuromonadaceae bacterium]|nr:hypothetical protein [Desulfuromonadaceae bacterium]
MGARELGNPFGNPLARQRVQQAASPSGIMIPKKQTVITLSGVDPSASFDFSTLADIEKTSFRLLLSHPDGLSSSHIVPPGEIFPFMGRSSSSSLNISLGRANLPTVDAMWILNKAGNSIVFYTEVSITARLVITEYDFNHRLLIASTLAASTTVVSTALSSPIIDPKNVYVSAFNTSLGGTAYRIFHHGTFRMSGYYPDTICDVPFLYQYASVNYYMGGFWCTDNMTFKCKGSSAFVGTNYFAAFEVL